MDYDGGDRSFRTYERRRTGSEKEKSVPKKDFMTGVIITQIIVFSLLSLVFFFICKSESDVYTELKTLYNGIMQRDMTASEIKDAVKSVMQFIAEPQTVEQSSSDEYTEQSETAEDAEEHTYIDELLTEAGGEDLLYAGDNASFAPLYLSAPVIMPVEYKRVSSTFGYRVNPITNEYGFHTGLDLAADEGTDIKAALGGTVEKAAYSSGRGNYIIISSGGVETVYCHCSELIAEQGAEIKAGEVIAKVGSTGQSTGPHLHFEIKANGVYYNPEWVLKL